MLRQAPLGNRLPNRARGRLARWLNDRLGDLSVWSDIRAFPPLAVLGGVHCVAAMLLIRRSADAGSLKLTSTQIWVTGTAVALLVVGARAMLGRVEKHPPAAWLRLVAALMSAVPIVTLFFGVGKRPPFTLAAYLGMLALFVSGATWLWNREFVERLLSTLLLSPSDASVRSGRATFGAGVADGVAESRRRDEAETLRLKRTAGIDGSDCLEGASTADFACGQAIATLHIPFLPTFPRSPALVCEVDENAAVRIKGAAVYPYGCRVELKRTGDLSAAARVEVRFSATLASLTARAA